MASTAEVSETLATRLGAARVAHRDAHEIAQVAAAKFRALVIEAIESGMSQKDVARLAGVSRGRIHAIMVTEYSRP